MATIFSNRSLASSFIYRNVTLGSLCGISSKQVLLVNQYFDFGKMGMWKNSVSIDLDVHHVDEVMDKLDAYQNDILEQIDMLENIMVWIKNGHNFQFQEVVMQEKPLLFNAFLRNSTLTVQVFGEYMHDLELRCEITSTKGVITMLDRLEELCKGFRDHLTDITKISLQRLVNKA